MLSVVGSILLFIVFQIIWSLGFPNQAFYYSFAHAAASPVYYLAVLLTLVVSLLPRICFTALANHFRPTDVLIAHEAELSRKLAPYRSRILRRKKVSGVKSVPLSLNQKFLCSLQTSTSWHASMPMRLVNVFVMIRSTKVLIYRLSTVASREEIAIPS